MKRTNEKIDVLTEKYLFESSYVDMDIQVYPERGVLSRNSERLDDAAKEAEGIIQSFGRKNIKKTIINNPAHGNVPLISCKINMNRVMGLQKALSNLEDKMNNLIEFIIRWA